MPAGALKYVQDNLQRWVTTDELFANRRVVLFSCPGAFTTKSTLQQLPGYLRHAAEFHALGVDSIICISVNDPFVMRAWGEHCGVGESIRMLGDGHCEYHTVLGLEMDCTRFTLGWRSQRFSMLIDNHVVTQLNVEKPGAYAVSDASVLLAQLRLMPASAHEARVAADLTQAERRNVQRVHDWAAAYQMPGGSAENMVDELYADAPEVVFVLTGVQVARSGRSKEAWREVELGVAAVYASRRIVFDAIYARGDTVAIEARIEQVLRDGTQRGWPFATFLSFDAEGRIVRDRTYMLHSPHQKEFERAAIQVSTAAS